MGIKIYLRDSTQRSIALCTETYALIFRHSPSSVASRATSSTTSLVDGSPPRCIVKFSRWEDVDMRDYRSVPSLEIKGTLGLVTINADVFLCVVNDSHRAATVRPGETIQQIRSVEFHCLTRSDYDHLLTNQINAFPTNGLDADGYDLGGNREPSIEHPCLALKKLLSGGSFYYSADFDLTKRLQDRPADSSTLALDSLDAGFLWNAYMIQPLVEFRSRLSEREKEALDQSRIITSAIRGFAGTMPVPASSSPLRHVGSGLPSNMTLISRLSSRRAGTRFNARGIDDDGNVANFVETETIFCAEQLCYSYVQCRGSVPLFWEQQSGLPGQQKIQITRSAEATAPAFNKHFESLSKTYGDFCVINLLSDEKPSELQLTQQYSFHINNSSLNESGSKITEAESFEHQHLKVVNYDFHAETRGPYGYDAASGIQHHTRETAMAFEYYLSEEVSEKIVRNGREQTIVRQNDILKQAGIFRTNCLDCLDRTNLIQTIVSQMVFQIFLNQQGEPAPTSDFWARHGTLWADCGDALSKIYAGTGALKSSFTRSGKHSLAGVLADVRKSAQRFYVNNFEDKSRQNTIDMLLGRLIGQMAVQLYDPINDWVMAEIGRRTNEFTSSESINIWIGTFNLNGKTTGVSDDLSAWLCPKDVGPEFHLPEIYGVAFQEIVELDVQQIMSTDPHRRQAWEEAVRKRLNANAQQYGSEEYILLRGGQLVGASLSVFVKASVLPSIKCVEGAVKKTGINGMAGNKGAVAIRFEYADTSICLVTAHLAAGFANYEERNQDYRTISSGLRFQRNRLIENHQVVIWFGDFNYRIGIGNERARALIDKGDLATLYENDQLNIQMVHGRAFKHYSEMTPTFLPTYKYNIGTDEYDTSEKARIPAWCDRILTRGEQLKQIIYASAPLRFSDHRPVYGLFRCTIGVVDQVRKDQISNELYDKRRNIVGNHTATLSGAESDDESIVGYDAVEPGLPPASSDRRKWWLDNGMPARSTATPPSTRHTPNPSRTSNPWSSNSDTDWIKVDRPAAASRSQSTSTKRVTSHGSQGSEATTKQAPTAVVTDHTLPALPPRQANLNGTTVPEQGPALKEIIRKAAPPRPDKPNVLRSESSHSSPSTAGATPSPPEPRRRGQISQVSATGLGRTVSQSRREVTPLPDRTVSQNVRSAAPQLPTPRSVRRAESSMGETTPPPPPPRRQVTDLMAGGDADADAELNGWVPLKPQ